MSKIIVEPTHGYPIDLTEKYNIDIIAVCPFCRNTHNTELQISWDIFPESATIDVGIYCERCEKYKDLYPGEWEQGEQ